ncbi:hemolysin family protein [Hathewaya histolytica]|uniref:hemolysin family protein n=1 Tax=Hathewaya histolytica TaxID=1498 RepID=UPI003B67AB66
MKDLLIIILLIGVNGFFAAAEISIISLNELSLQKRAEDGDKRSIQLLKILKEPSKFLATIQVGVTLASFFTSASATVVLVKSFERVLKNSNIDFFMIYSQRLAFIIVTLIISYISLLFGELIPKRIGLKKSEKIANKSIGIINVLDKIARPLVYSLTYSTNFFIKLLFGKLEDEDKNITEEEIKMLIDVGEEKGLFGKTEKEMINSIFTFDDLTAFDVMTPRIDMVSLNLNSDFKEVLSFVKENKRSRIPIYEESQDRIVGILYAKDLINFFDTKEEFHMKDIIREPFFVTGYIKIDQLFKEMQIKGTHMSIVIDEYGSTAGLVTMEDLVEEIFGNIYDEYEEHVEDIYAKDENEFEVDGGVSISELNESLGCELQDNYDTISGLILDSLGRFPKVGENLLIEGFKFTILDIEDKRIKKILINKDFNRQK